VTQIYSLVNQKGGVGKTTVAINLAYGLALKGRRVLVIDLDPQAWATLWIGIPDVGRGIADFFTRGGSLNSFIRHADQLDIIPASPYLTGMDRGIESQTLLKRGLADVKAYDFILIDCPPALGILTLNSLAASDRILAVVEMSYMAMTGLDFLIWTIQSVSGSPSPESMLILANRYDARTLNAGDILERLKEKYGKRLLHTVIHESVRLRECPSWKRSIFDYAPASRGADDFHALADEIIRKERSLK
jgi:chromosome partitioning protein